MRTVEQHEASEAVRVRNVALEKRLNKALELLDRAKWSTNPLIPGVNKEAQKYLYEDIVKFLGESNP